MAQYGNKNRIDQQGSRRHDNNTCLTTEIKKMRKIGSSK